MNSSIDEFSTEPVETFFNKVKQTVTSSQVTQSTPWSETWLTRDGRVSIPNYDYDVPAFFKEHLEYIARKNLNIQSLDAMEFIVSWFHVNSNEKREINLPKKALIRFSNLNGMPPQLGRNIEDLKYDYMTPIQSVVIPYVQNGKDVVGCSETGSGKTVAYLFPWIGNMLVKGTPVNPFSTPDNKRLAFPLSLVLVPTREWAEQVYKESKKLCYKTGILTVKVYGGVPADTQISALKNGCDILIATPGRLLDHIRNKRISLKMTSSLIIDEADRMLDMGFEDQLNQIINDCEMPQKGNRQNWMFSATFSEEVREISRKYWQDFFFVHPKVQAPKQIKQELIKAEDIEKPKHLCSILQQIWNESKNNSVIIFMDTKRAVDDLSYNWNNRNFNAVSIHGDRKQFQRQSAIESFANGKSQIWIATDVASRGWDFPNVTCVINYEMPTNFEDYIHRIGRSGRMGQIGRAVSFWNEKNGMIVQKLFYFFKQQGQIIPQWFTDMFNQCREYASSRMQWSSNGNRNNGHRENYLRSYKDSNWGHSGRSEHRGNSGNSWCTHEADESENTFSNGNNQSWNTFDNKRERSRSKENTDPWTGANW